MSDANVAKAGPFNVERLYSLFTKAMALFFVIFGIQYWVMAIGLTDPTFRFDTMPTHWKTVVAIFAVLHPIVALGLWGGFKWGIVVWAVAAILECIIYGFNSENFGTNETLLFFHVTCFVSLIVYFIVRKLEAIRRNRVD